MRGKSWKIAFSLALFWGSCAFAQEKTLKIFNWSDYIDPQVISAFEKETGIKVIYDTYDNAEILETKLVAGRTGYDLIVVTASFLPRQIPLGLYTKLDTS